MPDVDLTDLFAGIREDVQYAFKPRFDEAVVARARRRRRWQPWTRIFAALVASSGLTAGLVTAGPGPEVPVKTYTNAKTPVVAGDPTHLYQLVQMCQLGDCVEHLAVSFDQGSNWTLRRPPGPSDATWRNILGASGSTVAIAAGQETPTESETWWISSDAGLRWESMSTQPGSLTAAPLENLDEARIQNGRILGFDRTSLKVATNTIVPLHNAILVEPPVRGRDWWIVGYLSEPPPATDPRDVRLGVGLSTASSHGDGRFRDIRPMPREDRLRNLATDGVATLYALYAGVGKAELFVSRDAGRTWTAGPTIAMDDPNGDLFVTGSGVLYVSTRKGVFRSTDQGRSLQDAGIETTEPLSFETIPNGGYVASTWGYGRHAWISQDGLSWTRIID